jgi:HK97 gp10 family phage protein
MADEISVKLEGTEAIFENLDKLIDPEEMKQRMAQACALVERTAKQKAPKGNGALRRSITSKVETIGGSVQGIVFTPLEYAPYVEYGTGLFAENGGRKDVPWSYKDDKGEWHSTSGMKPHPYMRPALTENTEAIKRILKGANNDD